MRGKKTASDEVHTILAFSACDTSNNDGYIGHTAMVVNCLREQSFDVYVYGYCTGVSRISGGYFVRKPHEGYAAIEAAIRFCLRITFGAKPDAIVLTSAGALWNPLFAILALLRKIPIIYDCQDPAIEAIRWRYHSRPWFRLVESYLRWGMGALDAASMVALSVSPGVDKILRGDGWAGKILRLYNIHNAIDNAPNEKSEAGGISLRSQFAFPGATVLIYVGGIQPSYRGLEEQIEAVRICVSEGINVVMAVLYGSGDPTFISDLAGDLIANGRLKLFRNLAPGNVRAFIGEGDVAVSVTLSY